MNSRWWTGESISSKRPMRAKPRPCCVCSPSSPGTVSRSVRRPNAGSTTLIGGWPRRCRRINTLWQHLREILALPHAAAALRTMHSLNLLTHAVPEFEAIDLLVLRDLYHRYTVDEHTFLAIEVLHQLKNDR